MLGVNYLNVLPTPSSLNVDDCKMPGQYLMGGQSIGFGSDTLHILTLGNSGSPSQIIIRRSTNQNMPIYYRTCISNTWTELRKIESTSII